MAAVTRLRFHFVVMRAAPSFAFQPGWSTAMQFLFRAYPVKHRRRHPFTGVVLRQLQESAEVLTAIMRTRRFEVPQSR